MATSATDHYEVRFRETGTLGWSKTYRAPAVAELALDGLDRGKQYDYEVRAVSACGAKSVWVGGNYTVPIAPTLPAPGTLTTQGKQDAVDLDWSEPDGIRGDLSYQVQRGTSGSGPWTDIAKVKATRWTDKVPNTATNYYRVRVLDFFGNVGAWSAVVTGAATSSSATTDDITGGGNLVQNSDFVDGSNGFTTAASGVTTTLTRFDGGSYAYAPTGVNILSLQNDNGAALTGAQYFEYRITDLPVEVGKSYIASAYLGAHRCDARIYIRYYTAADVFVSGAPASPATTADGGANLSNYARNATAPSVAPATAAKASLWIRASANGETGIQSYLFMARPMFEQCSEHQTKPSPWSPSASGITAAALAAQAAAAAAQLDATNALNTLTDIASDNLLTPGEKPAVIRDRDAITAEQAGIDAKATAFAITTEKTAYDAAVTALTAYLATLTTPVLWSTLTGNTAIVGTTFRSKFLDVYNTRQTLLNKIYQVAKDIADSKINTFFQSTTPTAINIGDLWTNSVTLVVSRWNGSAWIVSGSNVNPSDFTNGVFNHKSYGNNLITNPSFADNLGGYPTDVNRSVGALCFDGWVCNGNNAIANVFGETDQTDGPNLFMNWASGQSLATSASYTLAGSIRTVNRVQVTPNTSYFLRRRLSVARNITPPAGVDFLARTQLFWFDITGAIVGTPTYFDVSTIGYDDSGNRYTAPATAVYAQVQFILYVRNNTGSAYAPAGLVADMRVYNCGLHQVANLDNDVQDGTNYGRLHNNDLTPYGGFNRLGLRVANSGQRVADQRNLPQITIGNGKAKVPTVITYSSTPTAATISVAAFTILAGSFSVAYSASSVGVTGTGGTTVTYFLYRDDPDYLGGSTGALVATTSGDNIYGNDGRIFIGTVDVFFPASGSGGGGGGRPLCVCTDMYLLDDLMAAEARHGLVVDCIDLPTSSRPFQRAIAGVEFGEAECVSLTTDGGARWDGSEDTPFDLIDGRKALAIDMLGEQVLTDWGVEEVVGVEPLGMQPVAHISVGGVSYAAGAEAGHRIYSHNLDKP